MITIGRPYIEERGESTFLLAKVSDTYRGKDYTIWYSVDNIYGSYLCNEYADAYLVLVLQWAMKSRQDITVEAPVSPKLLFNINNTVQPLFEKMLEKSRRVRIMSLTTTQPHFDGKGVGCCCSLGVDSFSTFLRHNSSDVPEEYRVTHLTLFNSGQLGVADSEGPENSFRSAIQSLQPFVSEVGLPLVAVDTNLNEFYIDTGIKVTNNVIDRTLSCVLALQKLFGKYIFSSSYSVEHFIITDDDEEHIESVFVPLLGTENVEVVLSDPVVTRVEKTRYISNFPITKKYLDVCWATQMSNGILFREQGMALLKNKKKKNCGRCSKCLRTMLTLDLLGILSEYEGQFEMEYYLSHKDWFVAKVLVEKDNNVFFQEISDLMAQTGFVVTSKAKRKMFFMKHPYAAKIVSRTKKLIERK